MDEALKDKCDRLREKLRGIEIEIRGIKEHSDMRDTDKYPGQHGEMIAQSMLSVRAVEEARMRLGKVLQYAGDGKSIYDKA